VGGEELTSVAAGLAEMAATGAAGVSAAPPTTGAGRPRSGRPVPSPP